ncbi:hypothetical protein DSM25559_4517 [Agrobacterium rosae]|uniref:Uncharacterized protein n=1 Tax=Agrobacterium rosae TaxID=1972867 RepID=A0A1R3U1A6_9HYPH|nr:hypothetical protein DSM25559_4517 [Agrobacterium rosae]
MLSRASRPLRLTVPPEIFRLMTKPRRSLSDALVCSGVSGRSRTRSSSALRLSRERSLSRSPYPVRWRKFDRTGPQGLGLPVDSDFAKNLSEPCRRARRVCAGSRHASPGRAFPRKPTPSVATGQQGVAERHCSKGLLDQRSRIFRISSARLVGAAASRTCLHQRRSSIVLGHMRTAAFLTLFNTPSRILVGIPIVTIGLRCKVQKNMPKILLMQNSMIPAGRQ